MLKFFRVEVTNTRNVEVVNYYRENLIQAIEEIAEKLQTMNFDDLNCDSTIHPSFPSEFQYYFSKVYEHIESLSQYHIYQHALKYVQEYLKDYVYIDKPNDLNQVHLLMNAGLFAKNGFISMVESGELPTLLCKPDLQN